MISSRHGEADFNLLVTLDVLLAEGVARAGRPGRCYALPRNSSSSISLVQTFPLRTSEGFVENFHCAPLIATVPERHTGRVASRYVYSLGLPVSTPEFTASMLCTLDWMPISRIGGYAAACGVRSLHMPDHLGRSGQEKGLGVSPGP